MLGIWLNVVARGEGKLFAGDAARLRKGLFEGKFAVSPGDVCLSESAAWPCTDCTSDILGNHRRVSYPLDARALLRPKILERNDLDSTLRVFLTS